MVKINNKIKCACGCGMILLEYNKYGYKRKYIKGHARGYKRNKLTQKIIECKCGCGRKLKYLDEDWRPRQYLVGHNPPWNFGLNKYHNKSISLGAERNSITRKKLFKAGKIVSPFIKNQTFEQTFGRKRAKEILLKSSKRHKDYFKNHPEVIEQIKINRGKQVFSTKNTSIEIKIQNFLKKLRIKFYTNCYVEGIKSNYRCDIFVPSRKLIIECDGDYWHANPLKYPEPTNEQKAKIKRDKSITRRLKKIGFLVLRLWEYKIKKMSIDDFKNILYRFEVNK